MVHRQVLKKYRAVAFTPTKRGVLPVSMTLYIHDCGFDAPRMPKYGIGGK